MALHQYIGARYVPKFYVNSDNTSEWRSGVIYEPLTIVTYNNKSYTSKKPVPANIGNPSANPDYWVATGNYNQQIADISARFDDLEATVLQEVGEVLTVALKHFNTVEDMVANFKAEDRVCVVDQGEITLDGGVNVVRLGVPTYYKYQAGEENFEYALDNGGYAVLVSDFRPVNGSTSALDALPKMLDVGYSYCGVNKPGGFNIDGNIVYNVQYLTENGPYMPVNYHNGLQCSQFVRAVLSGLYYEASRLADENNINLESEADYPFRSANGEVLDLSASEMAHYAYAKGWFKFDNRFKDIEIGDIAFFRAEEASEGRWRGIGHCALCVGKSNSAIMFMNAGSIRSITGFARNVIRPGKADDAVNFVAFSPVNIPAVNPGDYALIGYARIPYNTAKVAPSYTRYSPAESNPYTAGHANFNFHLIRDSDNLHGRYAILNFNGFTGAKNSNSGFSLSRYTNESAFPAQGTLYSTVNRPTTNATMPVLWNCDGDEKVVSCAFVIRTTDTTEADYYIAKRSSLDVYE